MQLSRTLPKPPVGVIFDCDFGNDIDSVLALGLLYGLDNSNESRVVSVSVSKSNLNSARLCDAIVRFYVGASWGQFAAFARTLPVGLSDDGKMPDDPPMAAALFAKRDPAGKPLYHHAINDLNDTAEVSAQLRNAFTAQHDGNALVVLAGPATNLAKALDVPGAKDLIKQKVRLLSVAAGSYAAGDPDANIKMDIPAARKLFAEWPTPIVAVGSEIGSQLPYPASSIEKDFAWAPSHPIVDAYKAYKPMPYDAPTRDMAAALQAVRPKENYFKLSEPGTIKVLEDGRTLFEPSPNGKHQYVIFDPTQKDRIIEAYAKITSLKPVPRRPRFLQQQQQEEEKKPDAPKPSSEAAAEKRTN